MKMEWDYINDCPMSDWQGPSRPQDNMYVQECVASFLHYMVTYYVFDGDDGAVGWSEDMTCPQ